MVAHMFPAAPSAQALENHRLYIENLKACCGYKDFIPASGSASPSPNMVAHMFPNHSKVPAGAPYKGNRIDRSSSY
jgi:hypothetical protein